MERDQFGVYFLIVYVVELFWGQDFGGQVVEGLEDEVGIFDVGFVFGIQCFGCVFVCCFC